LVSLPPLPSLKAEPENLPLHIIYEDEELLVVNKAPGMVTHPAPGNYSGTLVNAILGHCNLPMLDTAELETSYFECELSSSVQDEEETDEHGDEISGPWLRCEQPEGVRPGIVHRLDKGTSGLLVVAKSEAAMQSLAAQFRERTVDRTYVSVTLGVPGSAEGLVQTNIARDPRERKRMAAFPFNRDGGVGRHAVSRYKVVEELGGSGAAVVAWRLETGRTHQIRVHARHIGHPLVGDDAYGGAGGPAAERLSRRGSAVSRQEAEEAIAGLGRPALHAASLGFTHPTTGERLGFSQPVPEDMMRLVGALRGGVGPGSGAGGGGGGGGDALR